MNAMRTLLAFALFSACMALAQAQDKTADIASIGGVSFGQSFNDEMQSDVFGKVTVIDKDSNGAHWFRPFPQGEFLEIPISSKNLFYFKVTPTSKLVYEIGVKIDFILQSRNEVRRGLEKYRISPQRGYGTETKGIALSPQGAKEEVYAVFDRKLKQLAEKELAEAERTARKEDGKDPVSLPPYEISNEKTDAAPSPRAKLSSTTAFGVKLEQVFDRKMLAGTIKIVKEVNDDAMNIAWFVPILPPSKSSMEFFGAQVKAPNKESCNGESAGQSGLTEFQHAWKCIPKYCAMLTCKSRQAYAVCVAIKYLDEESMRSAFSFYSGYFQKFGVRATKEELNGQRIYRIDSDKEIRIEVEEKDLLVALSIVSLRTEQLALEERGQLPQKEMIVSEDILHERTRVKNIYSRRDVFDAK